ncbi:hypothetical protein HYN56_01625 [Flavobacterium crocinum]|uniref:Acyltransferase 3 domain-containing protein n=2 Tax=Flavobacterium crocinum TaxID=2183896 RepID=A0A2S1YG03_9FLAO|nr:acyltransferase family protein [Flavobacterium crocinum]AWK02982.1 hypothetical protein HYN56_01625 [Flavobacterium crocinum]
MATIAVIFLHVSAPLFTKYGELPIYIWNYANFFDSVSRFSVPVFVMISGALMFDSKMQTFIFLKKRFVRICLPFIFWSICYVLYIVFIQTNDYQKMSLFEILKKIVRSLYFGSAYHLWYIYMLFGLLLIVPILNSWITRASKKEIHYFLFLWFLTLFFKNLGLENYKTNIELYYFTGFVGYLVLGYYLSTMTIQRDIPIKKISLVFLISGTLTTFLGTYWLSIKSNKPDSMLYDFFSFNVMFTAVGIFLFFRISNYYNNKSNLFFNEVNRFSYGIYLIHVLILWTLDSFGVNASLIHPLFGIPVTSFLCLIISLVIIKIINKNKIGAYISG